jgi:hypothetical protein
MTIAGPNKLAGSERYLAVEFYWPSPTPSDSNNTTQTSTAGTVTHDFYTKESDVWAYAMVIYV